MNERITPYDPELAKSITKEGQRIVRELTHALEDKISMNERIIELAEQAEQHAHEQNDKYGVRFKTEYNRKFAELIVRECILQMDIVYAKALVDGIEGPDTFLNGVNVSIKAVNQHFGVEE